MEELECLATEGVDCRRYGSTSQSLSDLFLLRAHLITVSGDMPAVAKVSCHTTPAEGS